MNRIIMHIDADAFFASVEQGFNPLLRGKPVIVGGKENQRGVVHTASYEARARGIRTGMALVRAKALCPQAVFLKGDFEHYRAVSQLFQEVYLKYTPQVEFTSLDDAFLDLSGAAHLYPSVEWIARSIVAEVQRRAGVGLSVGVGSSKVIARIASDLKKPGGIVCVEPEREKDFLAALPVEKLPGIGRIAKERLIDLRIFRVGELARLPKIIVEQSFGKNGLKIWELANGIDRRPVQRKIIPRQISRETSLEEDTSDERLVRGILQYLTERVAKKLREQELVCRTLSVKIGYSDFKRHTRSQSLSHPSNDSQGLFRLAGQVFDEMRLRRIRIRHVGIAVNNLEPLNFQRFLFDEQSRQESLTAAIDEIRSRFGFMALLPADTLELKRKYRMQANGFVLHNPALTR